MPTDLAEAERRMRPGAWDTAGFLHRHSALEAVLTSDAQTLRALGVTPEAVGAYLGELLEGASASDLWRPVRVGDFDVELHRQRGMITCPWAPEEFESCTAGGTRPTANRFTIRHVSSGWRLEGFELSVHLICEHGFFGGPGTRFRVEPVATADVLWLTRNEGS